MGANEGNRGSSHPGDRRAASIYGNAFSKNDEMHEIFLLLFLHQHNRRIQIILNN